MAHILCNASSLSLSRGRIQRLAIHFMIIILVSACSPTTPEPGEQSVELDVYEIRNDLILNIIDSEVLSYVHKNPKRFKGMYFDIMEEFEKGYGRFFYVYGIDIDRSLSYVDPGCGWFERGGYQFVVRRSAEKYFRKTRKKHIFEYNYIHIHTGGPLTAYPYDPPMWGMLMEKDKYHIAFLPYNPNTELKDKAPKP